MINKDDIKITIFDFDQTMYYSSNVNEYYINYIKQVLRDLTNFNEAQIVEMMTKYKFFEGGEKRISFGKNCEHFGVTKQQWNDYRIKNFFQIDYEHAVVANNELYKNIRKKSKLYIVTNELLDNVIYKAKKMNISLEYFDKIYAPTMDNIKTYNSNKQEIYKHIIEENKVDASQVLVFGDRYEVDIKPLEELGGNGVLVYTPKDIENFYISNNKEF